MGRKLVRENELLRSGGLLSFPRTGCALSRFADLITRAVKSALRSHQPNAQRARVALVLRALTWARKLPDGRQPLPNRVMSELPVIRPESDPTWLQRLRVQSAVFRHAAKLFNSLRRISG